MKRLFICLILLPFLLVVHAASAFTDVAEDNALYKPLTYLQSRGVIQGYADGTFKPEQAINRAETLKMLYEGYKKMASDTAVKPFPDVPNGAWFATYVNHAASKGFIAGYPDGRFRPADQVKVVELLKMLVTVAEIPVVGYGADSYATYSVDQSQWYAPYLLFARMKHLSDSSEIALTAPATRGDVANMLYRVLYIEENGLESYANYSGGVVSYYADQFEGANTASGESYDHDVYTAAHPSFPFNTWVQVFSEESKEGVIVKVNDRGPYRAGGLVDLSKIGFEALYSASKGIFTGRLYQLEEDHIPSKFLYTTAKVKGLALAHPLPSMMRSGEVYNLELNVDTGISEVEATLMGSTVVLHESFDVTNKKASIPLYFAKEGQYELRLASSKGARTLMIYVKDFHTEALDDAPQGIYTLEHLEDGHVIKWNGEAPGRLFKVELKQGETAHTLYVTGKGQVRIPDTVFDAYDHTKPIAISLFMAKISTLFSHDVYSRYKSLGTSILEGSAAPEITFTSNTVAKNDADLTGVQKQILELTNADRALVFAAALKLDSNLSELAQHKAEDMAARNYFDHQDPDGLFVNDWKSDFGFKPLVAENIAFSSNFVVDEVFEGWHNSPGHYANMIDPTHEILGVGMAKAANGDYYFVQHFATPELADNAIATQRGELLTGAVQAGYSLTRHQTLETIAQEWANYMAQIKEMTFTINGEGLFDVIEARMNGEGGNFQVFSFAVGSTNDLLTQLIENLNGLSASASIGIGLKQDEDGWIRMGIILKK